MYVFAKNGKSWTCPDSSIKFIAQLQADTEEEKNMIYSDEEAVKYMQYKGFDIQKG